jgi:hypothetical protein
MSRIRKINVSQVEGNDNGVLPAGTIVAYEVNGGYVLRVHDGSTAGGVSLNAGQTPVIFNGTDGIVVGNLNNDIAALFNNGDVYITGGESLRFTGLNDIEGGSSAVLRFWNGEGRYSLDNDTTELVTLNVGNDADEGTPTLGFFKIITEKQVGGEKEWKFDADGVLTLPTGGDILDSEGNSVLGGATGDQNVWVQTFETDTPATDIVQVAVSVEYDGNGNIIALFAHVTVGGEGSGSTYYSVGKYTATGAKIWTARLSSAFYTDGWGLAVDTENNWIYVAGVSNDNNEPGEYNLSLLTKFDGDNGSVEWSKSYDFGYSSQSPVVDVDSLGNPVVVGYAYNGDDNYVTTTKINADTGEVIWSRALDGQGAEEAYGMAVGPDGEVVTVGYMDQLGLGSTNAVATVVTVPSSNPNWITQYGGGNNTNVDYQGIIFDIIVTDGVPTITIKTDPVGNRTIGDTIMTLPGDSFGGTNGVDDMVVNVASVSSTAGSEDDHMLVVKYNSAGAIQWQKAILFDAGFNSTGADADIDSQGNIYVCGQYESDTNEGPIGQSMSIVKFNSSGVKQWMRRVDGNCGGWTSSIVVGPDDKLYLSATTFTGTEEANLDISTVLAKYNLDGTVAWQRLLDYTEGLSAGGTFFFGPGGGSIGSGSNLAVKQDYVAVGLAFSSEFFGDPDDFRAAVAQVSAAGDVFTVGSWDFKAANFSGTLDDDASEITVVNAGKTDLELSSGVDGDITTTTVTPMSDVDNFLLGTLYRAGGADDRLVNGANQLTLETTGAVTLPQGGTISEGYVTSNPTIQLTPASPDVASQKLVIKGGGGEFYITENGIGVGTNNITWQVSDSVEFYVYAPTRPDETLYWWIVPEEGGISTTMSGTVELNGNGDGVFNFTVISDAYEFKVRVSPEEDNYDPANVGVESVLINGDAPAYGDYHLHLTTGDLSETSIFLGTDDHNVRTTVDGGISMTTTRGTVLFGNVPDNPVTGSSHFHIMKDSPDIVDLFFGDDYNYVKLPSTQGVEVNANGSTWQFGTDGTTTFPENTIKNVADTSIKIGNPLVSGVVVATVDELIPPGDVWRLFIDSDIYPALGTTVHIGGTVTTAWGTPITATITDIQEDTNTDRWIIHVAQDITAGFDAGPKTVSFAESYKTWSFGTDGDLIAPGNITAVGLSVSDTLTVGSIELISAAGAETIISNAWGPSDGAWYNSNGDNRVLFFRSSTTEELNTALAALVPGDVFKATTKVNEDFYPGTVVQEVTFTVVSVDPGTEFEPVWIITVTSSVSIDADAELDGTIGFTISGVPVLNVNTSAFIGAVLISDGSLTLPAGGDILDSTGTSVLGGGASTGDFTFSNADITVTDNASLTVTGDSIFTATISSSGGMFWLESNSFLGTYTSDSLGYSDFGQFDGQKVIFFDNVMSDNLSTELSAMAIGDTILVDELSNPYTVTLTSTFSSLMGRFIASVTTAETNRTVTNQVVITRTVSETNEFQFKGNGELVAQKIVAVTSLIIPSYTINECGFGRNTVAGTNGAIISISDSDQDVANPGGVAGYYTPNMLAYWVGNINQNPSPGQEAGAWVYLHQDGSSYYLVGN